jgi:hypothetical protein
MPTFYDSVSLGDLPGVMAGLAAGENVNGAHINAAVRYGITPLYIASYYGHTEIVAALIGAGAKVNIKTFYGDTPLFIAAEKCHKEIAIALIEAGADVNNTNINNYTPLFIAAEHGCKEIVAALIVAGADIHKKTIDGYSVLQYARDSRFHPELNALIISSDRPTGDARPHVENVSTKKKFNIPLNAFPANVAKTNAPNNNTNINNYIPLFIAAEAKMATLRGTGGVGAGVGGYRKTRKRQQHRGRAAKEDIFGMAKNAVCVIPPRKSGRKRRIIKKTAKHSMKSSNRHVRLFIK